VFSLRLWSLGPSVLFSGFKLFLITFAGIIAVRVLYSIPVDLTDIIGYIGYAGIQAVLDRLHG